MTPTILMHCEVIITLLIEIFSFLLLFINRNSCPLMNVKNVFDRQLNKLTFLIHISIHWTDKIDHTVYQ